MKRLEAISRTDDLVQGLQARLADPLWLLGRQWQVGELTGEDAATPVVCRGELEFAAATRLRAGKRTVALAPGAQPPLEALVEREALPHGEKQVRRRAGAPLHPGEREAALRRAATTGRWLLRAVEEALARVTVPGVSATALANERAGLLTALQQRLAFRGEPPSDPATRLLVLRAPSGEAGLDLVRATANADALLQALDLPPPGPAAAARPALAAAAFAAMQGWSTDLGDHELAGELDVWDASAAAHIFQIDAGDGGPTLQAVDHRRGRLDWDAVRFAGPRGVVDGPAAPDRRPFVALPRPVRYAGMPASRFWEFEDARVYFGGWRGGVNESVRWLMAEFAVVYGDDWFSIPVELPYGHLARVHRLQVRDCFGGEEDVPSFAAVDGDARSWRFFEVAGDVGPKHGKSPWLWVAPVLPDRQEGEPVEELRIVRDETLNLAWAIERTVEGADGRGHTRAGRAEPPATGEPGAWTYHLAPPFPPGWTPLVLEETSDAGGERRFLRRGRLPGWTAADLPRGRLLDATAPFRLIEALLPRGGLVLTRSPQRARSPDGQVWTWTGREVRPGAGPADGNLKFDDLERR